MGAGKPILKDEEKADEQKETKKAIIKRTVKRLFFLLLNQKIILKHLYFDSPIDQSTDSPILH
jgi:hypothetical protein